MPDHSLNDDLRAAAEQAAAIEDPYVIDFGECIARLYRRERAAVLALIGIDAMISGEKRPHDEQDPRLVAVRVRMRNRLQALVRWARVTGRM